MEDDAKMDQDTPEDDTYVRPAKRFRHQSYKQTLKQVHVPSALSLTQLPEDIGENDSHFHASLIDWRELNLSPAFVRFAGKADGLSTSMAMLLHNWKEIVDLWLEAVDSADDEALKPLLDLLQKIFHDLRATTVTSYPQILTRLLTLLTRSPSAETLTVLLATYTAFFKYVLIPTNNSTNTIETTWAAFSDVLPKCDPEVQRAVAEVWGNMVRRMTTSARESCVVDIVQSASTDVAAWVFVTACKSVSQTLHTTTPTIIRPVLRFYLSPSTPEETLEDTFVVIRRSLTALTHHCKSSEQYPALADILLDELSQILNGAVDHQIELLRRILEILAVSCSVRGGSRMGTKNISTVLTHLLTVPLVDDLHVVVFKVALSCLTSGDMAIWMGPGRKVLERVCYERPSLALQLTGALSDMEWGGWKMIALPHVMKRALELLGNNKETLLVLEVLNSVQNGAKLSTADERWKDKLAQWVESRFANWEGFESQVHELYYVIGLADLIPKFETVLTRIIRSTLLASSDQDATLQSYSSWVLGACMNCLSSRPYRHWKDDVDLASWANQVTENAQWASNGFVLDGLVQVVHAAAINGSLQLPFESVYTRLQDPLYSHSRLTRLNVLRLLASPLVATPVEASQSLQEVVKMCLQAEESSLDVQGVRERVHYTGRLNRWLKDDDELGGDLLARWLVAQFKINLRPLWLPAAEALAAISQRKGFDDIIWGFMFQQLKSSANVSSISEPEDADDPDVGVDDVSEEERTWRDPSAHKMRMSVNGWTRLDRAQRSITLAIRVEERFDALNYELQILNAMGVAPTLAEKHSRDLVPYFLSLTSPDDPTKDIARTKLAAWLKLYSKFVNPKAVRSSQDLRTLYTNLLSHPDRQLQKLALDCILTFKEPELVAREDEFKALLDDTRWRDQLTNLEVSGIAGDGRPLVVDVLLRLLYGVMLERKGKGRSKGGMDRRAAVLGALGGCSDDELTTLVDLMLLPIVRPREGAVDHGQPDHASSYKVKPLPDGVSDKQLVGFLTLLGDVMKNLGTRLLPSWNHLLETLLDVIGHAQSRLSATGALPDKVPAEAVEDVDIDDEDDDQARSGTGRAIRTVRQLGLKRFVDFFRSPVSSHFDFAPYIVEAFRTFISPRIPLLDAENTQAPSALLELFHTWSLQPQYTTYLVLFDNDVLPKVYDCLVATNVKPSVTAKVFDIVEHLLTHSEAHNEILDDVFKPHVSLLLRNLAIMFERAKGLTELTDQQGRRQINILSQLAPYMEDSAQASTLLTLITPVLRKPAKVVPEKLKVDLINIMRNLFALVDELANPSSPIFVKIYSLLAHLFQSVRSRPARIAVDSAFQSFAELNPSLNPVADLLHALNAYSVKRMDEPDFDRRLSAFATLNEQLHDSLSAKDWLPVLHNMLNFIQDPEELTVRSNSATSMKRFIDRASEGGDYEETFVKVLFPGLKNGLRSKNELVRSEILGVVAYAVQKCERISSLQEMRPLLGGDEEASFFNNILHIQIHRRTRALRRLADYSDEGHLRSATLAEIFIPLVNNFTTSGTSLDHHLINESIVTLGRLAKHLHWGAYHAVVQQYLRLSRNKDQSERIYVRTLVSLLDNFHFSMDSIVEAHEEPSATADAAEVDDLEPPAEAPTEHIDDASKRLARISEVVNARLLPNLLQHLEKRDENEDSLRIPIAVGIVRVAMHLPQPNRDAQVTRLITVLSQVFRSKSQDTRILARETLCKIATMLGPAYLPLIIRELRTALLRGPHLHVLAFVTHALLVHVTSGEHAGSFTILDECVSDVAHVSAEVIFGESGKDLQSEDFKTKMREVRGSASRGLDAFAVIAKFITPPKISTLLVPIRNILQQTETLKVMQQVEDLLRRIASGLNANEHLTPVDLLVLCHTLISQNAKFLQHVPKPQPKGRRKEKVDAVVELKRNLAVEVDHYANNSFRFIIFGLELFNTAHKRSRFDFQDPAVIARLEPMVQVIGNALYSKHMQVVVPALKAATAIVKCPLKSVPKSLPVIIRQMIDIVKQTGSTEAEVVQTAFKCLGAVLRDQPDAQVKEKDLVYLLQLLSPDLEEPSRQAAVFTMLRAIVARKFVVPEIYDLMDRVSEIMVTNQSSQVQELCRGVLLQFLLEYPQGKGRLKNNMTFLAKNLSYVYESGRKSVMELLSVILLKFNPALIREFSDLLFVALVMVIANDEFTKCREMASELIKSLFARLEPPQRRVVMSHVHSWASQHSQAQLARVSSQIYNILIDHLQDEVTPYAPQILEDVNAILTVSATSLERASLAEEDAMELDVEWQIPYHASTALSKLLTAQSDLVTQSDKVTWPHVVSHLLFPHPWVRTVSCRLLGMLLTATPVTAPNPELSDDSPFSVVGMEDITKKMCLQLRSENLDNSLGLQIVKNLFYVGKCFYKLEAEVSSPNEDGDADEGEDEDGDDSDGIDEARKSRHPLSWLFSKLSYQARSAHIARRNKAQNPSDWHEQPAAILRWFAAMVAFMDAPRVEQYLVHILSPLYRIADEDTIRDPHMDELKTLAIELQDLIQNKVGTTAFSDVYNKIRQNVLSVRRERKTARAVQAAINPKAATQRKMQRNSAKKDSRKRKNKVFAEGRGRIKRRRDE